MVGQKMCATALNVPVSVMPTAGEGGTWGMAVLASFMLHKESYADLTDYLDTRVFDTIESRMVYPDSELVQGFSLFLERYVEGLAIEQAAVDYFLENWKK